MRRSTSFFFPASIRRAWFERARDAEANHAGFAAPGDHGEFCHAGGADTTLEALDCGAFDYLPRQSSYASLDIVKIREDLVSKIRAAAESRRPRARRIAPPAVSQLPVHSFQLAPTVLALGTSTGGPKALQEILPKFPVDLSVPVLVV